MSFSFFLFSFASLGPALQRQVQNGPTSDEIEAQRARYRLKKTFSPSLQGTLCNMNPCWQIIYLFICLFLSPPCLAAFAIRKMI